MSYCGQYNSMHPYSYSWTNNIAFVREVVVDCLSNPWFVLSILQWDKTCLVLKDIKRKKKKSVYWMVKSFTIELWKKVTIKLWWEAMHKTCWFSWWSFTFPWTYDINVANRGKNNNFNGVLDGDFYVCWARRFVECMVSILIKSIYDIQQASWSWMRRFNQVPGDFCFKQNLEEAFVYTLQEVRGNVAIILVL